jgi:Ca2+-binding EF-hand superfamily protein
MFTTQQTQGGPRYSSKVLIGNWNEDVELEQVRFKDFLKKRETGSLSVHQVQGKISKSMVSVGHSFSSDGRLRFGDKVMLGNQKTRGILACDLSDRIQLNDFGCAVTTSNLISGPVARAVFILGRISESDGFPGDYLHFGQPFALFSHPKLYPQPLYLHSTVVSPFSFAKFSRYQEVCLHSVRGPNTIWIAEHANPKVRFESEGTPVLANSDILIKHNQTGQWLSSDNINYRNDFGLEYEVSCHSYLDTRKTQQLGSERSGKLTTDIPSRLQGIQNVWSVFTSDNPQAAEEKTEDQINTHENILSTVRKILLERGAYGIRGLAKVFKNMDENGNKSLDPEDFKWGLYNYGIYLNENDLKTLMRAFDRNGDGVVNFDEFLTTLKGKMNEKRLKLVALAYEKLDKNNDGQVTLDDIARIYDASKHPEVRAGRMTEEQVFNQFISMWDTEKPDGIVTLREFARYYEDISASIDSDDYFEAMIRSAWKL